jgi:predicted DNA-binding antitoxin AbrB/MazE fold protein
MASIEVIYENGVFRPLEPVDLPEGVTGEVVLDPGKAPTEPSTPTGEREVSDTASGQESPGQRAYRLLMEIAALPYEAPDTRTDIGKHHDDVLYPKEGRMP